MPVVVTNIHVTAPLTDAIDAATGDLWIVDHGILVASDKLDGYASSSNDTTLVNYGSISSGDSGGYGAVIVGQGDVALNEAGGTISGEYGVLLAQNAALHNFGLITGVGTGVVLVYDGASLVDNRGTIFSLSVGISEDNGGGGPVTIDNSGLVEGVTDGMVVALQTAGKIIAVVNSGTITGGTYAIYQAPANFGSLSLENSGTLNGGIALLGTGNATVIANSGRINGSVILGSGNDRFNGAGGVVTGTIDGGPGNDTLTGGPRADRFVFDTALNAASNVDLVTNFRHGVDKIDLSASIFTAAGPLGTLRAAAFDEGAVAHRPADRIIYNPVNGWLTYDSNGSHAGGAVHFATLAAHLPLASSDFIIV